MSTPNDSSYLVSLDEFYNDTPTSDLVSLDEFHNDNPTSDLVIIKSTFSF